MRVARRKALDVARARSRQAIPTDTPPESPAPPDHPEADGLWDAVAALPERQRLAVAYHYLGGLPHAETAERIGGNADAARRATADGIKGLRRTYRTDGSAEGVPR